MSNLKLRRKISKLLKIVFLVIIVIGIIAYTGIDFTTEYDIISKIRTQVFENVIDPLAKKVLKSASESDFDVIVDSAISKYGEKNE